VVVGVYRAGGMFARPPEKCQLLNLIMAIKPTCVAVGTFEVGSSWSFWKAKPGRPRDCCPEDVCLALRIKMPVT